MAGRSVAASTVIELFESESLLRVSARVVTVGGKVAGTCAAWSDELLASFRNPSLPLGAAGGGPRVGVAAGGTRGGGPRETGGDAIGFGVVGGGFRTVTLAGVTSTGAEMMELEEPCGSIAGLDAGGSCSG